MNEKLTAPEVMDENWFREGSLNLLREQLARQSYPGYPSREDRYWTEPQNWLEALHIPGGRWTTSPGDLPTSEESTRLYSQGLRLDTCLRPLHPWIDDMRYDPSIGVVTGRGFYRNWGPNYTADPIVVRRDLGEPHILLIERKDKTGWALPGGFVDGEESGVEAAFREAKEETGLCFEDFNPICTVTYTGPLADLRVTANAWPETTAVRFEIPIETTHNLPDGMWEGGDDALTAGWFPASVLDSKLFGSHILLIRQALNLP